MLERLLRTLAVLTSLVVVLGWVLFASDQAGSASEQTTTEIAGRQAARTVDPSPEQERVREELHGDPRELVDDANDVLLSPFAGLTDEAGNRWVRRTVPALLALLVYGFGLGVLARVAVGR
ncbi:MAG: hypothetical protein JWO90_3162 [Solirubrobacterales bacterium]|nr:hypothetical protein [Solirubrobacterales bacterium]